MTFLGLAPSAPTTKKRRIPVSALDDTPIRRAYPAARDDKAVVNQQSGLDRVQCRLGPLNSIEVAGLDQLSIHHQIAVFTNQPHLFLPGELCIQDVPAAPRCQRWTGPEAGG